jgi:hypothetical protein
MPPHVRLGASGLAAITVFKFAWRLTVLVRDTEISPWSSTGASVAI